MKQTVKQYSQPISDDQWAELVDIVESFAKQKDTFLVSYAHLKFLPFYNKEGFKKTRAELVAQSYKSPFGLQGRQWKMALSEANDCLLKQWEANIEEVKQYLYKHVGLSENERHYANWLLYKKGNEGRDFTLIQAIFHNEDRTYEGIYASEQERKHVRHYLKRTFHKVLGKRPRVKLMRSMHLDTQLYKIEMRNGVQWIGISTKVPKKRLWVPLTGIHKIKGNIKVVLDPLNQRIEVHTSQDVTIESKGKGEEEVGIDFGISEVLVDDQGNTYGEGFSDALKDMSNDLCDKSKKRQKLWALYRKCLKTNPKKAKRIYKHNLGIRKLTKQNQKAHLRCQNEINHAFNRFFEKRKLKVLGHERLTQFNQSNLSKDIARRVNNWIRKHSKNRLDFLCEKKSVKKVEVNPAYTSQTCPNPDCGYVHPKNRNGDRFKCKNCGWKGHADQVGALNVQSRINDSEITIWTPYKKVKEYLMNRFKEKQASKGIENI